MESTLQIMPVQRTSRNFGEYAEEFTIIEIKTGKQRTIRINMQLHQHIRDCYEHINPFGINVPVLISQKGTVYTVQRINVMLKAVSYTHLIRIDGQNIYAKGVEVDELRKNVGMVFQRPNPFPKSIFENVAYAVRKRSSCRTLERLCYLRCVEPLQTASGILHHSSDGMGCIRPSG